MSALSISLGLLASASLWARTAANRQALLQTAQSHRALTFQLTNDYSSQTDDGVVINVNDRLADAASTITALRTRPTVVYKPRSVDQFMDSRRNPEAGPVDWIEWKTEGPDVEDRHTLKQLAMMSGNAYALPGQKNWYDLDEAWNQVG